VDCGVRFSITCNFLGITSRETPGSSSPPRIDKITRLLTLFFFSKAMSKKLFEYVLKKKKKKKENKRKEKTIGVDMPLELFFGEKKVK
jgi:hypothetical protein